MADHRLSCILLLRYTIANMDTERPATSPRHRPRPLTNVPSPLNPVADGLAFHLHRRPSNPDRPLISPYHRKYADASPRGSPRSPLAFLPSSADDQSSPPLSTSQSSAADSFIRTPLTFATPGGDLPYPSPAELPPPQRDVRLASGLMKHRPSVLSIHIDSPARRRSSASSDASFANGYSSSCDMLDHRDNRPIAVRRLDPMFNIPASPPIIDPGILLARPAVSDHPAHEHSIAAPFANLATPQSSTSPTAAVKFGHSPLRPGRHVARPSATRRPSALARELGDLDLSWDNDASVDSARDGSDGNMTTIVSAASLSH